MLTRRVVPVVAFGLAMFLGGLSSTAGAACWYCLHGVCGSAQLGFTGCVEEETGGIQICYTSNRDCGVTGGGGGGECPPGPGKCLILEGADQQLLSIRLFRLPSPGREQLRNVSAAPRIVETGRLTFDGDPLDVLRSAGLNEARYSGSAYVYGMMPEFTRLLGSEGSQFRVWAEPGHSQSVHLNFAGHLTADHVLKRGQALVAPLRVDGRAMVAVVQAAFAPPSETGVAELRAIRDAMREMDAVLSARPDQEPAGSARAQGSSWGSIKVIYR